MTQSIDDLVDIVRCCDIRGRKQDMVAALAICGSTGRITGKAAFECGGLDPLIDLERRIERRARAAIRNQLDGLEQPTSPDIADVPVIAKTLGQPPFEVTT